MSKLAPFVIIFTSLGLFAQTSGSVPTRPVAVLFSDVGADGNPVHDLSKDKFSVLDSNTAATVSDVHSVSDAPLSVAIVLLASKTNFGKQRAAAADLVQKLIRSDRDRAFIITAGGDRAWPKVLFFG